MPKVPFSVFASPGLGLSHSSQDFISLLNADVLNAGRTKIAINAATGNVVVQDTRFSIRDDGVDLNIGMLWNAQDPITPWRFAVAAKIKVTNSAWQFMPQAMGGQTLTLIEADGREVIYRFDKDNCYLCTEPDQFGVSRLSIVAEGGYKRYFPHDGSCEIFNSDGELIKKVLASKKEIIFTYDKNNVVALTLPSKRILKLEADAKTPNLRNLILIHDDKTSIKLASYESYPNKIYDLVTQVWQNNLCIHKTTYCFKENTLQISASDKTGVFLTFDSQKVIQSFTPGLLEEKLVANWRFNLLVAQGIFKFTDSYNSEYIVGFDGDKTLTSYKKPQDNKATTYQFKLGQLCKITSADGASSRFEYENVTGLQCRKVDRLQTQTQTVYFTADSKSNLLGTKIAEYQLIALDEKDVKEFNLSKGDAKDIKRDIKDVKLDERGYWYIYNSQRQLIYTISAAGRVSQYNYDDKSHLITRQQARPLYDIAKLKFADPKTYPDEKTLKNWWNLKIQTAQDLQITQFEYDDYGRKKGEGNFTQVALNDEKQWVGVLTDNIQYTKLVLDPCGNIIEQHVATSYNSETQQLQFRTTLTDYDRLARPLKLEHVATGAAGLENQDRKKLDVKYSGDEKSIVTNYQYAANQQITRFANGLIQKRIYNSSYECIEEKRTASNAEARLQIYKRDVHGRIQNIIYADKRVEYFFYDVAGRLQCKIEPNGRLSTYTYDAYDNLIVEKIYKALIPEPDKLTSQTLNAWIIANQHYAGKIYIYDQEHQLRYEIKLKTVIDEKSQSSQQGFVTEYQYLFANKIAIIEYENTLINFQNVDLSELPNMIAKMGGKYRETRNFFDTDNLLIGTQILCDWQIEGSTGNLIPIGFLTEYIRDGLTNSTCERVYLKPLKMGRSLDEIRSNQQQYETLDTLYFYDNAGNKIAAVDADRYLTTFTQNSSRELTQTVSYLTVLEANAFDANKGTITVPAVTDKDRVKKIEYDSFGRQKKSTQSHTQLQIEVEYDTDDHEVAHIETDLLRPQTKPRISRFAYNLFGDLISEASPRILVVDAKAPAPNWTSHVISVVTGLKLCTRDPLGQITIYFYDNQRRLDTLINAEGGVTRYQYDIITEQPSEIYQYYTPLTPAIIQSLQQLQQNPTSAGFIQANILQQLPQKQRRLDRVTTMKYDETGLCISKITPNGAEQQLAYTNFGQLKTEKRAVDATRMLEVVYEYDWRGNRTATLYDPKTLNVQITQQFNDPLNRVTTSTDKLHQQLQYQYKGLRQQTVTSIDLKNDVKNNEKRQQIKLFDSFMRVLTESLWDGVTKTTYIYDDVNRTQQILSPEQRSQLLIFNGYSEIEMRTQFGGEICFEYGVDGQLERTLYPNGNIEASKFNLLGWRINWLKDQTVSIYEYNKVGHNTKLINGLIEKLVTVYTPNIFGENEVLVLPDKSSQAFNYTYGDQKEEKTGVTKTKIMDPNKLSLVTKEKYNYQNKLTELQQGDSKDTSQYYVEVIQQDLLNREAKREVKLENQQTLLLNQQTYNAADAVLTVSDGLGQVKRNVYDARGNLRFQIDAAGFVVEKRYDVNDREIIRREYVNPLTIEQLSALSDQSTPKDIATLMVLNNADAVRQRIYDGDGLLRFEITFLNNYKDSAIKPDYKDEKGAVKATSEKSKARLTEWRYNNNGQCVERHRYANSVVYPDDLATDENTVASLVQMQALVKKTNFAQNPKNHTSCFAYNKLGQMVLKRDPGEYIVETRRDTQNRVIARIQYANQYSELDFSQNVVTLQAQLNNNPNNYQSGRYNFFVYDVFGNLRFSIDGNGFVKEQRFDAANRLTDVYYYVNKLSTHLNNDEITQLYNVLSNDTNSRDITAIINQTLRPIVQKITSTANDFHEQRQYDSAGRLQVEIDGELFQQRWETNALGLKVKRHDKNQQTWITQFDSAKRIQREISPVIDVSLVEYDEKNHLLKQRTVASSVNTYLEYDAASNIKQITYAESNSDAKQSLEPRAVRSEYDRNNKLAATVVSDVVIDDGTADIVRKDRRPEIKKSNLEKRIVRDYAGREIVNINETGVAHFVIYDRSGRQCFNIDADGFVCEFRYEDSFSKPTQIIHYAEMISKEVIANRLNGFDYGEMLEFVAKADLTKARTVTLTYDRRGLKLSATKDQIITAAFSANIANKKVVSQLLSPQTLWQYNAFAEVTQEDRLIDGNNNHEITTTFYDNNGNAVLQLSPAGYVLQNEYGAYCPKQKKYLLLRSTEYANAITANRQDYKACLEALIPNPIKDRNHVYIYDRRFLCVLEKIYSQDNFHSTDLSDANAPQLNINKNLGEVSYRTIYDGEERAIVYTRNSTESRYIQRNARGDVIFETDFPQVLEVTNNQALSKSVKDLKDSKDRRYLSNKPHDIKGIRNAKIVTDIHSQGFIAIPGIQHLVNAHGQRVGTRKFSNSALINVDENGRARITPPQINPEQDELSLVLMSNRGYATITQNPQRQLKYTTFDATGKTIRSYYWRQSGYTLASAQIRVEDPSLAFLRQVPNVDSKSTTTLPRADNKLQDDKPTLTQALSLQRNRYNNRGQIIFQSVIDDANPAVKATELETYKKYNAFGECVGEGPTVDKMRVVRVFDKAGNVWLSNEDQGIATVSFYDGRGNVVATFRSADFDLLSFQQDPLGQIAAKRQLLDSDYSQIYQQYQRTFLQRDVEGNVVEQYTPGFESRGKYTPKNLSIAFSLTSDRRISQKGKALTWPASDEKMLEACFVIRTKGTQEWSKPLEIKRLQEVWGVDLDPSVLNLPTDMYEYQLDYYFLDPDTKTPDPVPNYRAEGEMVIDNGNYQNAKNLVWYLQNQTTLVLTGDIKDVSGIELINDEKVVTRIAGTNVGKGQVVVELADQVSGDYDFRILKGIQIVQQNLPLGKTGNYSFDLYTPAFEFNTLLTHNPNFPTNPYLTSSISWDSLPAEIKQIQIKFLQMGFNYSSNTFNYSDKSLKANTTPQKIAYDLPAATDILHPYPFINFSGVAPFVNFAFYAIDTQHEKMRTWLLGTFPACNFRSAYDGAGYGIPYTNQFTRQHFLYLKNNTNNPAHALSISDVKNKNYGSFQLHNWVEGSYKVDWKNDPLDAKSANASVLSVSQAVATGSINRLHVQTLTPTKSLSFQIIKLINFKITKCKRMGPIVAVGSELQLNYAWDINVAADHYLQVTHSGLDCHIMGHTMTALPFAVGNLQGQPTVKDNKLSYPLQFQKGFFPAPDSNQRIGKIKYDLVVNDDVIPMAQDIQGTVQNIDSPEISVNKTNARDFKIKIIDITSYPDLYTLYISNIPLLPVDVSSVKFEYFEPSILDEKLQPRELGASITKSRKAIAVPITGLKNSGQYTYHFRFLDAAGKSVNVNIPDMKQEKDGWFNGSFVFQKGNDVVSFSQSKPEVREFHQPSIKAKYDRWHNRLTVTNRSGHTTSSEFNLFNDEITTTTHPVKSVNAAGIEVTQPLVTQYYFNTNRQKIAERAPNGGMKIRIVNQRGQNLLEIDADGVYTTTGWDLLGRRVMTADMKGDQTTYRYTNTSIPGLREETRTLPKQFPEIFEINSENCRVHSRDVVEHTPLIHRERHWYFNYNASGHEILRINPLGNKQTQQYDARTQIRTLLVDEDGNQQTWETDKYFANVVEHTDFSGQKITYVLNFNKQRKSEIGTADGIKIRGQINLTGTPVPARNIRYCYDAAGHTIEIADDGAQLTTRKEYDVEDYVTTVKFDDNNDGHTYQATNTEYDELHRICLIYDTRYAMHIAYDLNSNRRSARAYIYNDNPKNINHEFSLRESWYDYTVGGRVLVRDGQLINSKIKYMPDQGMQLIYDPKDRRRITQQITQDAKGIHTKTLRYDHPNKNLLTSTHSDDGTSMLRELDVANRCHVMALQKDGVTITADILDYRDDDVVYKQRHEDKGKVQSVRTSTLTSAGRIDTEKNEFYGEVDSVNFTITDNYKSEYYYTDDVKLQKVTVTRDKPQNVNDKDAPKFATVYTTQDANGNIKTVQGALIKDESFREFRVNSENCIVWKRSALGINYYFYAEKQPGKPVLIAYFGDIPDDIKQAKFKKLSLIEKRAAFKKWIDSKEFKNNPPVVNIDTNHQALSPQYPPMAPSRYVLPSEMSFDEIAETLNYSGYAEQIAAANNHFVSDKVSANSTIIIPPLYFEVAETAWNGSVPAAEKIIGSLYPVLPIPMIYSRPKPPPRRHRPNFFIMVLEVVASAAVMAIAPALFAEVVGVTFQAMGLTGAALEAATGIAAYAAAGAAANLASQSIAIAAGEQKGINLKSLATSTLSAAITAGVSRQMNGLSLLNSGTANASGLEGFNVGNLVKSIATAEAIALTQQAVLLATRLERSFDWKALEAAAFSASVRGGLTAMNADKAFITGVTAVADPVERSLVYGEHLDPAQVTASALGQMVGSYVGSKVLDQRLIVQQQQREKELATKLGNLSSQHAAHAASIAANRVMKANAAAQAHINRDIKTGVTSATRSASSVLHDESDISDWNHMSDAKNAPAALNSNLQRLERYLQNPMGDSKSSSSFWNRLSLESLDVGARNLLGETFNGMGDSMRDKSLDFVSKYASKSLIPHYSFLSQEIRLNPLIGVGTHNFDIPSAKNLMYLTGAKVLSHAGRSIPVASSVYAVAEADPGQKTREIYRQVFGFMVSKTLLAVATTGGAVVEVESIGMATAPVLAGLVATDAYGTALGESLGGAVYDGLEYILKKLGY